MKIIPVFATIAIAAIGSALAFTNPTEADYADYASQTLTAEVQASLCEASGIPSISERIDQAISGFCERTIGRVLTSNDVKETLLANTERKNRFLFSTYETTLPSETYRTIGVFNRFYPYGSSENTPNEQENTQE